GRMPRSGRALHAPLLDRERRAEQLARERSPGAGADPADPGGERVDVGVGDEVAVGGHLDPLAAEEAAADRMGGDARDLALRDPRAELAVVADEVFEVGAPERRDVALEAAGVRDAARAERSVTGFTREGRGELRAARGELRVGKDLTRSGTQVGDEIVHLTGRHD